MTYSYSRSFFYTAVRILKNIHNVNRIYISILKIFMSGNPDRRYNPYGIIVCVILGMTWRGVEA